MIDINLLPPERRPVERTPLPRFMVIVLGVALFTATVFLSAILFIVKIPQAKSDYAKKMEELKQKEEEAKEADRLEESIAAIDSKLAIITDLEGKRRWTPVLDQLYGGNVLPEEIWLDSLSVSAGEPGRAGKGSISGYARGNNATSLVGRFIKNMQDNEDIGSAFKSIEFQGMGRIALSKGKNMDSAGGSEIPAEATEFSVTLEVPALVVEQKKQAKKKVTRKR